MAYSISPEVADILTRCTIEGTILRIPGEQLERPLYAATNKALTMLGGKWDRRQGGHVFPFDPSEKIAAALGDGRVVSRQQALQHFDTPAAIAVDLVDRLDINSLDVCLEPSAGRGRIVAALADWSPASIIAVEIDPDNAQALEDQGLVDSLIVKDFLEFRPAAGLVSVVAMNPPFNKNQDIRHVCHAFDMLAGGGRLGAIVSEHGFTGRERECVEWRQWLADNDAEVEVIPAGEFKESGTSVQTRMVLVRKGA